MPGGLHPPIEVIMAWPAPNYIDLITLPKSILVMACILAPLSIASLVARLWARIRIQHNAGPDDWLMVVAIIPTMAHTILLTLTCDFYGVNRHTWDTKISELMIQRKLTLASEPIFVVATGLVKISILLFYRRLCSTAVSRTFYWVNMSCIVIIAAYTICFTILPLVGCQPFSAYWNQLDYIKVAEGFKYKCYDEGATLVASGVISAVQDFITALIPTFVYWNIRVPIRQKLVVIGIFALGYAVVVMGTMRAYKSWFIFYRSYDLLWYAREAFFWSIVELHLGTMCANAPALKVFFVHYLQSDDSRKSPGRIPSAKFLSSFASVKAPSFWKDNSSQPWWKRIFKHSPSAADQSHDDAFGSNDQVLLTPDRVYTNDKDDRNLERNSLSFENIHFPASGQRLGV